MPKAIPSSSAIWRARWNRRRAAIRSLGDHELPEDKRIAQTNWNPYKQSTPLLESGLMGPVVIYTLDPLQEADELSVAVLRHAVSDDRTIQHREGCEQRRSTVAPAA